MTSTAHTGIDADWREFADRDAREDQITADLAALSTEPGF